MIKNYKFKIIPCNKNIGAKINCNLKLVNKKQIELIKKSLIDKKGFYFVLPSKLENGILVDGFFAAKLMKNDK